nr:hypothetical protein [Tanacetum cinerariifolium]
MMLERLSQPTAQPTTDPLALLSNASYTQHGSPSSSTSSFTQLPPPRANSTDPITDEAGPSYDLDILSEVQDHDKYLDDTCAYHEEHVMPDSVQLDHGVDLHADYTSVSNMIP